MGLDEIRVNDISTTFTRPKNYIPSITGGAVFVREKWNTPMGEVYPVKSGPRRTPRRHPEGHVQAVLRRLPACPAAT